MKIADKIQRKVKKFDCDSPVKIAFLGDSVTHGCFETEEKQDGVVECDYDGNAVYHARLKNLFGAAFPYCPVNIINAGISGGNAKAGFERLERDVLSAHPDLAVVCFGLNDVFGREAGLQEYLDAMEAIFQTLKKHDTEAILLTPNMMCTYIVPQLSGWLRDTADACADLQNGGMMDAYMNGVRNLCERIQVPVCDCYQIWKNLANHGADIPWLLANHINHPIRELHQIFASELFRLIIS